MANKLGVEGSQLRQSTVDAKETTYKGAGSSRIASRSEDTLDKSTAFRYFGSDIIPVIVNPASAWASVSAGCAPPSVREYLPARMTRLP